MNLILGLCAAVILIAIFIEVYCVLKGPNFEDRVWALDTLFLSAIAGVALYAAYSGLSYYLSVVAGLILVGFVATIAFARYLKWKSEK